MLRSKRGDYDDFLAVRLRSTVLCGDVYRMLTRTLMVMMMMLLLREWRLMLGFEAAALKAAGQVESLTLLYY